MSDDFPLDRAAEPSWLTVPLSFVYGLGVRVHQAWRTSQSWHATVPVISVGGITVGGSGKTPLVMALCELLCECEPRLRALDSIAVLSRGYGRQSRALSVVKSDSKYLECGDEPLLIKRSCPQVAVVVHGDRRVSAKFAVESLGAKLLLLDDGFQHQLIYRDVNILITDGERPFGNGFVLPAGTLREPKSAIRRATFVMSVGMRGEELHSVCHDIGVKILSVEYLPLIPHEAVNARCFAFCGIARPVRFYAGLEQAGVIIAGRKTFPDHHAFSSAERDLLTKLADECDAQFLVTTAKDAVKLPIGWCRDRLIISDVKLGFGDPKAVRNLLEPCVRRIDWNS